MKIYSLKKLQFYHSFTLYTSNRAQNLKLHKWKMHNIYEEKEQSYKYIALIQ